MSRTHAGGGVARRRSLEHKGRAPPGPGVRRALPGCFGYTSPVSSSAGRKPVIHRRTDAGV